MANQDPKDILKETALAAEALKDVFNSLEASIKTQLNQNLIDADAYTKIYVRTLRSDVSSVLLSIGKKSEKLIDNQNKLNKGQLASKDISKQLEDLENKRLKLANNLITASKNGLIPASESKRLYLEAKSAIEEETEALNDQLNKAKEIENTVGVLGKLVKGLNKIPIIGNLIDSDKALASMNQAAANGAGKMGALAAGAKSVGSSIAKGLADPLTLIIFFTKKAFEANAQAVELGKALGTAGEGYRETLANIELASGNINVTTANLTKAFNQLSEATGLAYKFTADQLTTQIKLTEQVGLQADEAAQIQNYAVTTGKTSEETYRSFVRGLATARNQLKVGINFKSALAEAAKVSGELAANLGYNPERIANAVVQMKALGTTLEQTKSQGDALLNFESSIESELKSELLTGQQLNLERARAAALTGDQVTLAKELANQGMTLQKFEEMNVLARRSYAEALGLNVDQLSKQLQLQKQAIESGKSFAQVSEEEAAAALERQNAQDKFNKGIEKLTSLVGNLFAGPLGQILDVVIDVMSGITWIFEKLTNLFGSTVMKVALGTLTGVGVGIATGGVGLVPALVGGLGGLGLSGASAAMGDDVVSPGYGKRTILSPEGSISLNNNDTVIAGTNLGGGSIDLSPMIAAINSVKASVDKLYSKDINLYMDGKQIGTTLTQGSYKLA